MNNATKTEWHSEDIKAELRKKYGSLEVAAQKWGYTASAISKVWKTPWPELQEIIAADLGVLPETFWPNRYESVVAANKKRQLHANCNESKSARNSQLHAVA